MRSDILICLLLFFNSSDAYIGIQMGHNYNSPHIDSICGDQSCGCAGSSVCCNGDSGAGTDIIMCARLV